MEIETHDSAADVADLTTDGSEESLPLMNLKDTNVDLPATFWNAQRGLLLVSDEGALRFTATGRAKYAPLLAKYGFALTNITTLERFREVMKVVSAGELEANELELKRLLNDPGTSAEERASIRRVLDL